MRDFRECILCHKEYPQEHFPVRQGGLRSLTCTYCQRGSAENSRRVIPFNWGDVPLVEDAPKRDVTYFKKRLRRGPR